MRMAAASWLKVGGRKAPSISAMSDTMLDAGMPLMPAAATKFPMKCVAKTVLIAAHMTWVGAAGIAAIFITGM